MNGQDFSTAPPGPARLSWLTLAGLLAVGIAAAAEPGEAAAEATAIRTFEEQVKPFFATYCFGCHGEKQKADLDLRLYEDASAVTAHRPVFRLVLKNLADHSMPPEHKPQPTPDERAAVVSFLEGELDQLDCTHPDPGRVTLRRLNRTEYNNTVRDLVGVDLRPADDFPMDDIGYGFDNIGDVLSVPPVLFERYLAAAKRVLDAAIVTGPPPLPAQRAQGAKLHGGQRGQGGARSLSSEGIITADFFASQPGRYVVRVALSADQAGDEPARAALRLDDRELGRFDITATREGRDLIEQEVELERGRHRIGAAFLNDYYQPDAPNPADRDRNLHVLWLELAGPQPDAPPPLPESHRRLFVAMPAEDSDFARDETARLLIGRFATRAFRRPAGADEVERLLAVYRDATAAGENFIGAVKAAFTAVLVSPQFLFRLEAQPHPDDPAEIVPLDAYALASRLSYFLWSTLPDDELSRLAAAGELRNRLDEQVRRMLADPRAQALVDNFAGQWLELRRLAVMAPDQGVFPRFSDELREAMRREAELFFELILREDRSVLEFLDADYTFVNGPLARHYGLAGIEGKGFRRVSLRGTTRGGLLTQASFLTVTSNPTRTSPVKRGKWILENILGTPPPDPPPNVPPLDNQQQLTGTLRQRMEQHRADPLCASCHQRMDPIGFGFENFDGIGAWRDRDEGAPVDPSGELVSGERFDGPDGLKRILLTSKRDEFLHCLAGKLLTFALGRGLEHGDECAVREIVARLRAGDYRFSELVLGVVHSAPFQRRRGEAPPAGAGAALARTE